MKKITIITRQLKKFGGIERFVTTLAGVLARDYQVQIVANYGEAGEELAFGLSEKVEVKFLSPVEPEEISLKKLAAENRVGKIIAEFPRRIKINREQKKAFRKFLKNLETDVIITERADYSFLVKKFYRGNAKLIATDHNFHQNDQEYIERLLRSLEGFDSLVVGTEELAGFYKDKTKTKVVYIPNALERIPDEKTDFSHKKLISVGRMVPEKDFLKLVDVMRWIYANDSEYRLTIVGDGPEKAKIEKEICESGLDEVISLPGHLEQPEIEKEMLESSLFIMTSKTEAFGMVLAEAMACGLPCVAFERASGARAQITRHTGLLIEGDSAEMMAEEIMKLLQNHDRLMMLQEGTIKLAEKYRPENVRELWTNLIEA